jgi:hypothetical protein
MSFSENILLNKENYSKVMSELKTNRTQLETDIKNITRTNAQISKLAIYYYHRADALLDFSINHISYKTLEKLVKECNKCKCCDDHYHKKPKSIEYNEYNKPKPCGLYAHNNNKKCLCTCRQSARVYFNAYQEKLKFKLEA